MSTNEEESLLFSNVFCDVACAIDQRKLRKRKEKKEKKKKKESSQKPTLLQSLLLISVRISFSLHGLVTLLFLRCLSCLLSWASKSLCYSCYMCMCYIYMYLPDRCSLFSADEGRQLFLTFQLISLSMKRIYINIFFIITWKVSLSIFLQKNTNLFQYYIWEIIGILYRFIYFPRDSCLIFNSN